MGPTPVHTNNNTGTHMYASTSAIARARAAASFSSFPMLYGGAGGARRGGGSRGRRQVRAQAHAGRTTNRGQVLKKPTVRPEGEGVGWRRNVKEKRQSRVQAVHGVLCVCSCAGLAGAR